MLLWAKEQGYSKFNMGMATLSNVGQVQFSFYGERIAGRVFEHFNGLYLLVPDLNKNYQIVLQKNAFHFYHLTTHHSLL